LNVPTHWYQKLQGAVRANGGMFNAHLHLDRANTLADAYVQGVDHQPLRDFHVSLHRKHAMIGALHAGPAYARSDFERRVHQALDEMIAVDTRRADTLVDVTCDRVGLQALQWMRSIADARRGDIDLRCAAYTPFGFSDAEPARWELMQEGSRQADFIASLPEADERREYPEHIGFMAHCQRVLELAQTLDKPLHVHTDQRFDAREDGTEQLIEAVRRYGAPRSASGEPMVWAIHVISPSCYEQARFERLLMGLREHRIGVITCPSAALGMRMIRPLSSPTGNSIPRVLEMLSAGVHVRLGSDNIADICSPSTSCNLIDEAFVLSAALRFYHPEILAALLCGLPIEGAERAFVTEHLRRNAEEIERYLASAH
jgi:cytosine deaminase